VKIDNNISKLKELDSNLSFFDEEDKILLLHFSFNNTDIIPLTEFAKINYITKGLFHKDFLLKKNAANSTFYKKLNNGIGYYASKEIRVQKIKDLLRKIENLQNLNLASITKILRNTLILP